MGTSREVPIFLKLARPKRFELLTPWFVAKYSIQLSYGRVSNEARTIAETIRCVKGYVE